ncbi:MAG TPA: ATP-binding protein [Burkholderiales bacterium]
MVRRFEAFRARDEYRTRGEGLGLGLFIAQAIARAHGGAIEVEAGGGETAFRLVLPR